MELLGETLLSKINSPKDVKKLNTTQLISLSAEIRSFLIKTISKTGGHLASNLGTVELTVAFHKIFDCPNDKIVFDVGHQCYTHKILTGRRDKFSTLRQKDGISGFPKPSESEYDSFIAGHASTSISAAYGIAKAFALQKSENYAVALIGDGAFTGGEAYEALNNAGRSKTRLIIILNHNDMSISKNVGAFARYLSHIRSGPIYIKMKRAVDKFLSHIPLIGAPVVRWFEHSKSLLKTILYRSTFFEEMGFQYFGPVDGHDLPGLLRVLQTAKESNAPVLIQVETTKGKGYPFAEENPGAYHATAGFDILNGGDNTLNSDCYSNKIGEALTELADDDDRICAITAAMKYGTGLHSFYSRHKDRFFDVGIAEAHAVTFAGGLASGGIIPVFCVYSSFLQRSYDQIIHDLSIDNQHVVLCVDRAGIVGEDGETHQGIFDAAFLSHIPNMTIYSPNGYEEAVACLKQAVLNEYSVVAVRYPRGKETVSYSFPLDISYNYQDNKDNQGNKGNKDNKDDNVNANAIGETLIMSYGRIFDNCYKAAMIIKEKTGKMPSLLKLCKIAPLPSEVYEIAQKYNKILFVEEGIKIGSIAEQFAAELLHMGFSGKYDIIAINNKFVRQGKVEEILNELGMDADSICEYLLMEELYGRKTKA